MVFSEDQKRIINTINGNIVVNATAGSGKTSVLTHRIANMIENHDISPNRILAITFSNKAKEHMGKKLKELTPFAGHINTETFHSLGLKIIQSEYGYQYKVWTTSWEKEACVNKICVDMGLCKVDDVPYNDIMIFIAEQKKNMLYPKDNLLYSSSNPFSEKDMKMIYKKYEDHKKLNNLIEFDDFLNMACDVFKQNKTILESYQNKFDYVLSDEYQDVSINQELLISYLGKEKNNTFIVGDVLQSIYSFRGGRSEYMLNFDRDWSDVKVMSLKRNYRCSKDIIDTANEFAESIPESKHRNYEKSVANNPSFKKPTYIGYENAYDEGSGVGDKIIEMCKSEYEYKDIAILARTNAQLQKIETTLHNKGIKFGIVDGKLFTELPEIQLILSYLKLSADENDNAAFRILYNKPLRWLSKKFLQEVEQFTTSRNPSLYNNMFKIDRRNWRFKNGIDEIHEIVNALQNKRFKDTSEMVKYLRKRLSIDEFVSKGNIGDDGLSEQVDNMDSFQDICKEYKTVNELVIYLNELNKNMNDNNGIDKKVKLMTIHKSKGLEYPVVFIIGCSDGLLPHFRTNDINDEKRLMYVGITRAEKELHLSSVNFYNDKILGISPFIYDMGDTIEFIKSEK